MQITRSAFVPLLCAALALHASPTAPKTHTVVLGASKRVPYTPPEATADTKSEDSTTLRVRPLLIDGHEKEWTVGEMHEVTDRSFVIRRALRLNDALPSEPARWTWQPGPWLQVDRVTGHITALHLPDFDPQISNAVWFRDYAAYCGIHTTTKSSNLTAIVFELGARKAAASQKLSNWPPQQPIHPACAPATWQRTPMRATLQATGGQPVTFEVAGTSSLIEEGESTDDQ